MESVVSSFTDIGTGSETASPPAAMRIEVWPPKVRGCRPPPDRAVLPVASPSVAEPTLRGTRPKLLEMRARTESPPTPM